MSCTNSVDETVIKSQIVMNRILDFSITAFEVIFTMISYCLTILFSYIDRTQIKFHSCINLFQ